MWYAHKYAALAFFVLESGFLEMFTSTSIIIPSLSLFIQIICYQGIIFEELNFFFYKQLPFMNLKNDALGIFEDFERWDILIMLDIVLFLSNLLMIFVFCIGMVFKDTFFQEPQEHLEKDFMEGRVEIKKLVLQVNSLAIGNAVYLYLIHMDNF